MALLGLPHVLFLVETLVINSVLTPLTYTDTAPRRRLFSTTRPATLGSSSPCWDSAAMAETKGARMRHLASKLAVEAEPGLTTAQLMVGMPSLWSGSAA